MNNLNWLCCGDAGLDYYLRDNQVDVFCGGISLNQLFHLSYLGEKNLFFYGPLSQSPEGERVVSYLENMTVTILNKGSSSLGALPPKQFISIGLNGEKSFDKYEGEIFSKFYYERPSQNFDVILLPYFEQSFSMMEKILKNPPAGNIVIDVLDGSDINKDLAGLEKWADKIEMVSVGCSDKDDDFFLKLKDSVSHFPWKLLVTRGKETGFFYDGRDMFCFKPERVNDVKDSTGAGDAFLSAFLHKYLNERNPQQALDFACRYAITTLQKIGPH